MTWKIDSWKKFNAPYQPEYKDTNRYNEIVKKIKNYPPLVSFGEVNFLKKQIADAGDGKKFILQGGDCAERFIDCNEKSIINKIKILLQMSVILTYGARKPIIKIGRIAGQYSKPRSNLFESINNKNIFTYRGDSINDFFPDEKKREPDPERLLSAFFYSVTTLNYIRAIISGGFADLHDPYSWNLHFMKKTSEWKKYKATLNRILDAINFVESFDGGNSEVIGKTDFFISHEGLLLGYEEALTRRNPLSGNYYNLGAHMLWIGERTRKIDGAHVEYFRGIENPIGIKLGPSIEKNELEQLIETLNPNNAKGKITLISRMGIDNIDKLLPLLKTVKKKEYNVTWSCDPMHGNIINTDEKIKTRNFNDILSEISLTFRLFGENNIHIGGVHFELTGDDVTECIGGSQNIQDVNLKDNYDTYCDPRLNYNQSLEMAFLLAEFLKS